VNNLPGQHFEENQMGSPKAMRALLSAIGVLVAGGLVATSVATSTTGPLGALVVAVVGVLGIMKLAKGQYISSAWRRGAGVGALVLAGTLAAVDGNWAESLWTIVPGLIFALAWMSLAKQLAPAKELPSAVGGALSIAGVTMSDESVAGWQVGGSPSGVVVVVREAKAESGPIAQWSGIKKLAVDAKAPVQMMKSQGIEPLVLGVVAESGYGPEVVDGVTVVSADRVAGLVKRAEPSIADPVALAKEAGITLSRQAQRALAKQPVARPNANGGAKKGAKVVHQGRVTKSTK